MSIEFCRRTLPRPLNFAVADTGEGIDIEDQEDIFNEFKQFIKNNNKGEHVEGSGLGLAITKGLEEALRPPPVGWRLMGDGADRPAEGFAVDLHVEAEGIGLGEAKWNALKQIEPRFPGITADCVEFVVVADGSDGPARVRRQRHLQSSCY